LALTAGLEALGFVTRLYHWIFYEDLIQRAVEPTTLDVAVGVLVIALVLDISRRLMAWEPPT